MATAKDIVNKMLEMSDPDDPTQYLKSYRQQWYSLMRGGAHVDTFKTIEAALRRAKETRLCRGKDPIYIEQHELPDAPEGVFVSTEPTGIVYDVTKDYRAVQRGITEAADPDAPEPYLDWLGQKVDLGPLEKIRFGAHIHLSDEDMIRQNASESGIDVDSQAFWDEVERCMAIMESHCLQLLRESGLHVSDEGHDETGARVASVWIDTPDYERAVALVKAVINWAEGDWPSTTSGTMDYAFGANTTQRIYAMTEDAARFIDVTIEFTGTDALVEWSRLNLNEAITGDPDDPEVFLRSYVPRMLGRVFIDFDVIKPHFPDAPRNWARENVNGVDLFRYNRVGEMREVLRQMKADHRQRGPNVPVDVIRYRYKLNNPQGSSIVRGWLDKIGCPVPVIQWVCETNAPIWFFVSAKEFNDYMRMVYPQVKLESLDDPPADLVNKLTPKVVCPNCGASAEIGYGPEKLDTHPTAPVHYDDDVELARYLAPGDEFDPNVSIHHFDVKHIYKCRQCNQRFDGTQPKLTVEGVDDPDDPVAFLKRFKPAWKLLSHIKNGHFYFIDDAGRVAVADYSMRNQRDPGSADDGLLVLDKTKPLTRYRGIEGRKMWHIPVTQYYGGLGDKPIPSATGASEEEFADLWPKLEPLGFTQQIREEDEDIDPKAYLDATTGWIDTFLNAGMTPSAEDTHRGQFWKRYECHGFNYLVVVSSRVPRFMIVERNDALYGTNTFRRVFEYPDGDINGLVTEFTALDRLLTKAITSAFDGFPAFDEKVDQLYKQHKRRRQRWLSGKIKEGVDDPDLQHYLPHISPERCLHCNNDLTQAKQVERNYYNRDSRIALVLPGHYEAADSAFEPDLRLEPAVLERLTNCPTFEDKCANCGTDTSQPVRHEESLDDPSPTYLEGIHELADVAVKLDELGFGIHKASHWGRWIVLSGHLFQPYSYNPLPPDQRITPEEYRARVERVMAEFQITQFHLTLGTDSFKLAVPKVQFIDGETLDTVKDWVTKHPSKNQSDWLPEALDPDDPDDPSVNVDRHIEAMDIDAMMERLGFYKRLPSWKCADPNYCWYERTMRGLRVSVIRKSDDEPHLFNVTFSRLKIKEYPAGKFPEYEEVAGFTAHVGDLEAKLRQFIRTGKLRLREGSDPDDPGLNIERFAKHVEQVEQDALDSAINMAVHEFELRVEKRGITTAREADQLAAEIGNQYAQMAGYENGSDEYDWVVSAVNNKAGEMFPGQWEDYVPEDQRKVMTHVSPQSIIESTLPSDYPGKTWQQVFEHFDNTPYKQLDVLVRSIRLRGIQYPIKLDEHGGQKYVTNGHHRLWLAHRLKLETVPVANVPNPLLEAKLLERNGKLNEMGGAVNIWLSPKGQAILCHDHAEHAASEILKKPLKSWPGTYWEARGRVYQEMFRRGWMRIAIPHAQKKLMVDYRGKTTEAQWEWIYEKAGQDKLAITDDQENVIVDYREGAKDAVQEAAQTWANVYRLPGGFRMVRDDNTAQLQTRSGQQIGFMAWRGASPRVGVTDRTIEIEHLEVNERYQNRGLGEAMLRQLKTLIPTLYPHARYVVAKTATSKGIIRLLRRVFGPELRAKGTEKLPKRSPADWIQTMNRGYALFKLTEALDVDDPSAFLQHMETDWRKILRKHGWKPSPHSDHLSYTLEFPDRVWGANWPLRIYAGHGWNPEPEFVYDHPDPDDPDLDAEDAAYEQWLADHPEGRRDVNFPDYIYFQFGREYYRRIEVPTNKLDVFCSRLLRAIKPILGTEHIDHDHPETSDLTTMVWNKGREIARELQIPLKESIDDPDDPEAFIRHAPVEVRAWAVGYHGHHQTQVDFNAEPYFAELAQKPDGLETMIAMAKEGFTMSHQVDDVGRWFSDTILKDLYAQSEMGVEVSITERDVKRWVEFNKPDWYPYLWPNDIKVQESKETVDYPAVYVQGRIFIGPSHFHIVSALEQLGIKLGGESHEEAHHGWWTSNSRFLDSDTDINELIKLDKRFAQSTESEPGVKGETLPKAKAMTGVREVHESVDLPPEDEPENVLPSAEKSLVTAELKRLDFGPKPERGIEWIYGEEMPRFWYNTYKGADGSNRAIYIYFIGGQTPEVQTRNYNAPAKAWFQRGKDAPPTAPAQSQAHLAAIIRDLDSAMQKSAADSLPVEQEFEAIERVIRHHRQWWEDTLDYLINTQGGTVPGRVGPGQPA